MASLVSQIRETVSDECLAKRCKKEGCSVPLKNAPEPSILIDMDSPQAPVGQNKSRCDYIFIGGSSSVLLVPLELKRGKPNASETVRQLQAGADIADSQIIPRREPVRFLPVVVHGGSLRRPELIQFRAKPNRIRFRGKWTNIKLARCGTPLIEALNTALK